MSNHEESLEHRKFKKRDVQQGSKLPRKSEFKKKNQTQRTLNSFITKVRKHPNDGQTKTTTSHPDKNKFLALEKQNEEKDAQLNQLQKKRQDEINSTNRILYQIRQFKKEARPLLAKNMLKLAEKSREERKIRKPELGHFSDSMRSFEQGSKVMEIRKEITEKKALIDNLKKKQIKAKSNHHNEQSLRLSSCIEYHQKELRCLQNEREHIESEVAVYKDRIKLAQKEKKCFYNRQGWPIAFQRYQTLELLGAGGFGQVYKCYDLETNRIVALKRISLGHGPDQTQRKELLRHIKREAHIQMDLNHENIARFQDYVDENLKQKNQLVFKLQYCSGPQLANYLRKNVCLQESKARIIMKQLFSAIQYLSSRKERIIHYDLKPNNIMFADGVVKILDFGLSKIMHEEDTRMDLTSQGVGTYWYLPPQTFQEFDPKISSKVDVWSLGVIFFELLYGRKPFGQGMSQGDVLDQDIILKAYKVNFPPDTPKKHKVSEAAKQFIQSCMAYRQEDRLSPFDAYNHPYFSK